MAEVMENGMHKEYASVGKANAGLTLGQHNSNAQLKPP